MFRKIISNLPFSPALVGQLGFYAKRLRQEETTRRLGLIFVALALVVQSIAVFQPSESANASSSTDMVNGGISSLNDYLTSYDANTKHLKDVMNYAGITRSEITSTTYTTFKTGERISWGSASRFSYAQGEREHSITDSQGRKVATVYSRPLKLWGSTSTKIEAWVGNSKKMGWFAIMKSCGNLVTETLPPPPPPPKCLVNSKLLETDKNCQPCPGNSTLWVNDTACIPNVIKSKTATNTSQGFISAPSVVSQPGDQISYTITVENTGLTSTTAKLEENLEDVLQYSTVIDKGGGTLNDSSKVLSWPDVTLKPKDKQTRTFVVKVLNTIPATATCASDPTSFDCVMTNIFGNSINIKVECPTPKIVETVANELPTTGPTENMLFAGIVFSMAAYFYARTRLVKKEVHLIRRDVSSGTL